MKHLYEEFRFCPRCGAGYRPKDFDPEDVVYRCAGCKLESYQNSKPSATMVIPRREGAREVVLLTRANEPGLGLLALPGGFLQYGEDAATGARREALEEVRIDVTVDRLLCSTLVDYAYRGSKLWVLELAFVAQPVVAELSGVRTEEAGAIGFYDATDIVRAPERLAFPEQAQVLSRFLDDVCARPV